MIKNNIKLKIKSIPKLRFPEFSGEWEEKKLGEVGKIITGNTPKTSNRDFYGGDFMFVSPVDIGASRYIFETKNKLTKSGFSEGRKVQKDYKADIYILALFKHQDPSTLNILDLNQWAFYIFTREQIKDISGNGSSVSLARLQKLKFESIHFTQIQETINGL